MNEAQRTIVIVGGVAGGASAATRARRMNEHAKIILLEKDEHVSFANCGLPYYIGDEITDRSKLLVATAEFLAKRFHIDVRTRHEAMRIDRERKSLEIFDHESNRTYEQTYDKLVLSPGASPLVIPIDGVDAPNVFTLRNVADSDHIRGVVDSGKASRVCVVGAGFIGLEMAESFARRGLHVVLLNRSERERLIRALVHQVEWDAASESVTVVFHEASERANEQPYKEGVCETAV